MSCYKSTGTLSVSKDFVLCFEIRISFNNSTWYNFDSCIKFFLILILSCDVLFCKRYTCTLSPEHISNIFIEVFSYFLYLWGILLLMFRICPWTILFVSFFSVNPPTVYKSLFLDLHLTTHVENKKRVLRNEVVRTRQTKWTDGGWKSLDVYYLHPPECMSRCEQGLRL